MKKIANGLFRSAAASETAEIIGQMTGTGKR